jgi:CubicO group peptidase (beta-lactamase class C family)
MLNLSTRIDTLRADANIPGLSLALVRDEAIVYSAAFGQAGDAPMTIDTPFEVASLSKLVFAYGALKVIEQRIIDLDTPLSRYLPQPYATDPALAVITARHILSHSSGFPNWRDADGLRSAFKPGSAFNYSTEGMIYLQTVLEHVLGIPFHEYLHTNLLQPLGMHDSQFLPSDMSGFPPFLPRHLTSICAISLRTTAPDYARFLMAVMCDPCTSSAHLSLDWRNQMLTPLVAVGGQADLSWGLGFGLQNETGQPRSFWHWGARGNQNRCFALGILYSQTGAVILTNHRDGLTVCEPILNLLLGHEGGYPALRWLLPAERWRADGK